MNEFMGCPNDRPEDEERVGRATLFVVTIGVPGSVAIHRKKLRQTGAPSGNILRQAGAPGGYTGARRVQGTPAGGGCSRR